VYLGKCYARFWSNAGGGSSNGVPAVGGGAGGTGSSNGIGGVGGVGGANNGYAYGGFVPNTYGQHGEQPASPFNCILSSRPTVIHLLISREN
jgi:hypothetical protein